MKQIQMKALLVFIAVVLTGCSANRADGEQQLLEELKRDEQLFEQPAKEAQSKPVEDSSPRHYTTIHDAFSAHDTNGDGYIDQHEFVQFQSDPEIIRMRSSIPELADTGPLLFEEIDENEDDRITLREMTTIAQPLLVKP